MEIVIRDALGIMTGRPVPDARISGDIRVVGGRIAQIGPSLAAGPDARIVDASGCVVYPGFISTHHHLFQSVLKGVPAGIDLPLLGWLRTVPYAYWHKLNEEALSVAARIGMVELVLSGTTTIADHHYMFAPHYRFDPADVLFDVAASLGVRFVYCRGGATKGRLFDNSDTVPMPTESLDEMIRRTADSATRYHDPADDAMRRVVLAPTTPPWSVEPGELNALAQAARQIGVRRHSHLSETVDYVTYCREVHNTTPVEFVAQHDWLGPDVWFAHLVHLADHEIAMLAATGTGMAHCPQSNCRLGSGVAPAERLAALGGNVSIGVDGAASNEAADMICETHAAWHVHRAVKGASALTAEQVLHWATAGGARVLGLPAVGTIAPGMAADLAIFDLDQPRYFGMHDPLVAPITCGGRASVRHLFVGGREIVRDGAVPGLDMATLRTQAARVVSRLSL